MFVGTRGEDYSGDIAIDNLQVTDGVCGQAPSHMIIQLPWKCDFEFIINTLCHMEQESTGDDFDWTVTR